MSRPSAAAVILLTVPGLLCAGVLAASFSEASSPAASRVPTANAVHAAGSAAGTHSGAQRATTAGVPSGGLVTPSRVNAAVTILPESFIAREPSIAIDSTGTIFVTGPAGLNHTHDTSASPVWKSTDDGQTWTGPIHTENQGVTETGMGSGTDSDIVIGPNDSVYVANLWGGNTEMAVSTDHGNTFTELPIGHITPVDDRPWLYYDPTSRALWMAWDGAGALHVGKALLGAEAHGVQVPSAGPQGQLVFEQDVPAVLNEPDRGCALCPPGTLVVDPTGRVHVAFTGPKGVGVASSTPLNSADSEGLTWPQPGAQDYVPGTANAANTSSMFQILRGDSEGNLYLVWSETMPSGNLAVFLSYKLSNGTSWHAPIQVSTPPDALFGTMAVVSPGNVDVAYYGSGYAGAPDTAPRGTSWDVYLAKVQDLFGTVTTTTSDVLPAFHQGTICTAGVNCNISGADTRLGDFFSIAVDRAGLADIITTADLGLFTTLDFIHELPPPPAPPTPGPAFVIPRPAVASGTMQRAAQAPLAASDAGPSTPAPDATAQPASGQTPAPGRRPAASGTRSAPRYPGGLGVTELVETSSGSNPARGPSTWVFGLALLGLTGGRFLRRRLRSS